MSPVITSTRPIALAGFMGVGKSSVGRLLAERLGRPFHDTDELAERMMGRSIADAFRAGEERAFREAEASAVRGAIAGPAAVVALGGGALLRESTRALLEAHALVVYLEAPWEEVSRWIHEHTATRPLLQGRTQDEIRALYHGRLATYEWAHVRVRPSRTCPEDAMLRVLHAIAGRQ